KVEFRKGEGPILEALSEEKQIGKLNWKCERLDPVFETIDVVLETLPEDKALIGFAGSPWTVACYMMQGRSAPSFPKALACAQYDPEFMKYLMDALHDATVEYLGRQIEAGVDVVQLFDSHAGLLQGQAFEKYVITPTRNLVKAVKAEYPDIPIIGFPRGAALADYENYAAQTGVDGLGLDPSVSLDFAADRLRPLVALQGNLDPELVLTGGEPMKKAARAIFDRLGPQHIFNLGHGVIKETPPDHVADLVAFVKSL
ncbi:MAG: uroporphyrinogen decarboxylase family protein, partial [Bdellovibrionales bacterium]